MGKSTKGLEGGRVRIEKSESLQIARLAARRMRVIQPPSEWGEAEGGTDLDCIVEGIDATWPLRLPPQWRLCQVLRYRIFGATAGRAVAHAGLQGKPPDHALLVATRRQLRLRFLRHPGRGVIVTLLE